MPPGKHNGHAHRGHNTRLRLLYRHGRRNPKTVAALTTTRSAAGALHTDNGNNAAAAVATLTVRRHYRRCAQGKQVFLPDPVKPGAPPPSPSR